jgi:hypothetical protein
MLSQIISLVLILTVSIQHDTVYKQTGTVSLSYECIYPHSSTSVPNNILHLEVKSNLYKKECLFFHNQTTAVLYLFHNNDHYFI